MILDNLAAEDRSSDPMILLYSYNTYQPSNINDEDFHISSERPLVERTECTEMVFNCQLHDLTLMIRSLTHNPPSSYKSRPRLMGDIQSMENTIKQYSKQIESTYLKRCDPSIPLHWLTMKFARFIILKFWLYFWYPPTPQSVPRKDLPRKQILKTAISILEITEQMDANVATLKYRWFLASVVQWHPLAVALAELCVQVHGPLVDRSWLTIHKVYEKLGHRVADTKEGMLWRPVKILYKKACDARQREIQGSPGAVPAPEQDENPEMQTLPDSSRDGLETIPVIHQDGVSVLDPTMTGIEFDATETWTTQFNMDQLPASDVPGDPMNWDSWNAFLLDAGQSGATLQSDSLNDWPMQNQSFEYQSTTPYIFHPSQQGQ
jgi:hypothetical protein